MKINGEETEVQIQNEENEIQNEIEPELPEIDSYGQYILKFKWPKINKQNSNS